MYFGILFKRMFTLHNDHVSECSVLSGGSGRQLGAAELLGGRAGGSALVAARRRPGGRGRGAAAAGGVARAPRTLPVLCPLTH